MEIFPTKINIETIREERQNRNNDDVFNCLINNKPFCGNDKAFKRFLKYCNITEEECRSKCIKDEIFAKSVSITCAKKATRQGGKDESLVLDICNKTSSKFGINIKNLGKSDKIPTKDGKLLSEKDLKKLKIDRSECLKSIDGIISKGIKLIGFVFAKAVFGEGGHQDNVFEESRQFAEWVIKHGNIKYIYVILIDTNLAKKFLNLKNKCKVYDNIWVVNHYEFQEKLIISFSK
jgi:hypothetical protein